MPAHIDYQLDGGVAHVTISHAKRFNAMSRAMWRQLRSVFVEIGHNDAIRCVWVSGHGAHFCAGGDISEYAGFRFNEHSLREFHETDVWGALSAMLNCDVPMVAQIVGNCMGAGVEIASCCDIRLSAESAQFGAPIAKLGFPMAPRELALVGRELGLTTARQMLLEAVVFTAPELLQRGFLSRVVADVDLSAVVQATVQRITALSPQAARLNKHTIRTLSQHPALINKVIDAIYFEVDDSLLGNFLAHAYDYASSAEQREGIQSFLEKRQPRF